VELDRLELKHEIIEVAEYKRLKGESEGVLKDTDENSKWNSFAFIIRGVNNIGII